MEAIVVVRLSRLCRDSFFSPSPPRGQTLVPAVAMPEHLCNTFTWPLPGNLVFSCVTFLFSRV